MIKYLKNLFLKEKKKKDKDTDDSIIDVIISLNKRQEINVSLFIDDKNKDIDTDISDYSEKCAEFLYIINSGKLKKQMSDILLNQIKKEDNQLLINNIMIFWSIIEKEKKKQKTKNTFICPTEVFTRYVTK
jgi:hypothetical protein